MNKYAELTRDLQLLESGLIDVLRSPAYADMVRSGMYDPDLSLLDALHAVQQCICTTNGLAQFFLSVSNSTTHKIMAHPLGKYTRFTPGDTGLLAEIQEAYGAQLQRLTKSEKLYLISLIASDLCQVASLETPCRIELGRDIIELNQKTQDQLATSDREGLLECLINGVRYQ